MFNQFVRFAGVVSVLGAASTALAVNFPPTITTNLTSIPVVGGSDSEFLLIGHDPEGAQLKYGCYANCGQVQVGTYSGFVRLNPDSSRSGYSTIKFGVTDGVHVRYINVTAQYSGVGPGGLTLEDNIGASSIAVPAGGQSAFYLIGHESTGRAISYACYQNCVGTSVNASSGLVTLSHAGIGGPISYNIKFGVSNGAQIVYRTVQVQYE